MEKKKVLVGMSGGVDSSVAAYLLKEQGYDVIGATLHMWQEIEGESRCCGVDAIEDARRVADMLEIPFYVLNFKNEFKKKVVDYFFEDYKNGRTPNPCIQCNRYVKWEALYQRAKELGAEYIATGHYARIAKHPETGRFCIEMSAAAAKDQTYVLYNLTQEQLEHTLMPCGEYTKEEIRAIAEKIGLRVADKPDSMEICFIPDNDYVSFIERNYKYKPKEGNFVDMSGNVLGKHKGIINYTVGQRKGLGIAFGKPMYVNRILPEKNQVVLGSNDDLFEREVYAENINFVAWESIEGEKRAKAKIRYAHKAADCTVSLTDGGLLKCTFDQSQRAATPGQALVVYDENGLVLCGGTIIKPKN